MLGSASILPFTLAGLACLLALSGCGPSGSLPVEFEYTENAQLQYHSIFNRSGMGCRLDMRLLNRTDDRLNRLDADVSFDTRERSSFSFREVRAGGTDTSWFTSRDAICADLKSIRIDITRCDLDSHSEGDCMKLVKFNR